MKTNDESNYLVSYKSKQIVKQVKKNSWYMKKSTNNIMSFFLERLAKEIQMFQELNKNARDINELSKDSAVPFTVVIMGEFKTGKSTFINALLGEDCLKSDVTPATAVVTRLVYSEKRTLKAYSDNEQYKEYSIEMLERLSSESDPEGKKLRANIHHLDVGLPNPILKDLIIVDTPGLNANPIHTEATKQFVNRADLVLWVFSYAKAGSRTELSEIKNLGEKLRPMGIVNRIDEIDPEEEDIDEILEDLKKRMGADVSHIVGISAFEAREAQKSNDPERLKNSKWEEFDKIFKNELIGNCEFEKYKSNLLKLKDCLKELYASIISKEEEYKKLFDNYNTINNEIENLKKKQEYFNEYMQNWSPGQNVSLIGVTVRLFNLPGEIENATQINLIKKSIEKADVVLIEEAKEIYNLEKKLDVDIKNNIKESNTTIIESQIDSIQSRNSSLKTRISKNEKEIIQFLKNGREAINKNIKSISDILCDLEKEKSEVILLRKKTNWIVEYGDILKNNIISEINQGLIYVYNNIELDGTTMPDTIGINGLMNKIDFLLVAISNKLGDDIDIIKTNEFILNDSTVPLNEYCNGAKTNCEVSKEKYFTRTNIFENNFNNNESKKTYTFKNGNRCKITWKDSKMVGDIQCIFNDGNTYNATLENNNLIGSGLYLFENDYSYSGSFINFEFNGRGTLDYKDGDIYVGEFLNDKLHGAGTYTFADDSEYKGDFKNNLINGQGIFTNINGDKYEGKFNGIEDCVGKIYYTNGECYNGDIKFLIKHGKGELRYESGETYQGEFQNDKVHGHGTYYFNNGTKFIGEFIDAIRIGILHLNNGNKIISKWNGNVAETQATIQYPSGDQFKGQVTLDKRNGQGVFIICNGDKYEGLWKDDILLGSTKYILNNGDTYIGELKNNSVVGNGTLTFSNGDKYNGNISNGIAKGKGQLITKVGKVYNGDFVNGSINGLGVEISPQEYKYNGNFKDGKKFGQGHLIYENKREYIGNFDNNAINIYQGIFIFVFENGNIFEGEYLTEKQIVMGTYKFTNDNAYRGNLIGNKVVGYGTYKFENGEVYSGDFEDGLFSGNGELLKINGDKYIGQFKNNKKNGKINLIRNNGDKINAIWKEDILVGNVVIEYINGDQYQGPLIDLKKQGLGSYSLSNGDKYYGDFNNDLMNGDGTLTKVNGDIYIGKFFNDKLAGKVKINYCTGNNYIGEYNQGKSGKGIYNILNIGEYEGIWINDRTCKNAVYRFLNGNIFYGDIFDNKMYEFGKLVYNNGTQYQGEFKENMYNGVGKLYFLSKDIYEGEFCNNKMHGQGNYTYNNGEKCIGLFENDSFIKGIYNFINGNQYSGELLKSKMNGVGTLKYVDGAVYVGQFKDGLQNGQGNFKNAKGNEFNGEFKNGKLNGKVTVYYINGDNYDGTFRYGKKHGLGIYKYSNGDLYQCEFLEGVLANKIKILEEVMTKKVGLFDFKKWF
ncbi:dynamin family protein [Clostridium estertheticum]|uniref:dynamin family protein n=1 Tax=Clostridium estertheticum TaxID=238834 RepID=UPI001C6EECE8|nr:dynamin family protein [Clostridium estertheticum]MBW9173345.1 dynamin family protein [Clostridium estertheticum]WLC73407.1 dynamin family protein [Clostridium estertheticum]